MITFKINEIHEFLLQTGEFVWHDDQVTQLRIYHHEKTGVEFGLSFQKNKKISFEQLTKFLEEKLLEKIIQI